MPHRRLVLAALLLVTPTVAAAEEPAPPPPPPLAPYAPQPAPGAHVPRLLMKTHSPALMYGGVALTAVGVLSLLGAASAVIEDQRTRGEFQGLLSLLVALPLAVHGLGCLGGGIPMIVIGNRKVPAGWAAAPASIPSISAGRGSGSLRWSF